MDTARLHRISFRDVNIDSDIHHLFRWLGDPEVQQWYSEGEHSLENYRRQFAPEPTTHKFIILIDAIPVGYLQAYRLSDEPEYAAQLGLDHDATGLDLLLGDQEFRGKGWGSLVLQRVLDQIVFGKMGSEYACCNPDPKNTRAVAAYQKAGFHGDRVVWIDDEAPQNQGYERIMIISKEEFYGAGS